MAPYLEFGIWGHLTLTNENQTNSYEKDSNINDLVDHSKMGRA